MSILLQVMDNAELTDNSGNKADFQNVVLIMTSNLGVSEANVMGFAKNDKLNENRAINKFFAPEFRNRLDCVVSFDSLSLLDELNDAISILFGLFIYIAFYFYALFSRLIGFFYHYFFSAVSNAKVK